MPFPAEKQNSDMSLSYTWTGWTRKDILLLEFLFQNTSKDWDITHIDDCLLQKPSVLYLKINREWNISMYFILPFTKLHLCA